MTTYSSDIIAADLKSKFNQISENDSDQMFYFKIADYGKYLLSNRITKNILNPLSKEGKKALRIYDEAFLEYIAQWKDFAADLLSHAKKLVYEDDHRSPFTSTMSSIEAILDGKRQINTTDALGDYWVYYWFLVKRFHDDGTDHVLIPKHFDKGANYYHLRKYYDKADYEWNLYKNSRIIQPWWGYCQIERLASEAYRIEGSKRIFEKVNEQDDLYAYDFRQVLLGNKPSFINRNDFQNWISLVHDYVLPRLQAKKQIQRPINVISKLDYHPDDGIASYKGEDYPFTGKARALLNFLYKNKNTPFNIVEIVSSCNKDPAIKSRKFADDKDIRDTITYIRDSLKVNIREYFPVAKRDGRFIWTEK